MAAWRCMPVGGVPTKEGHSASHSPGQCVNRDMQRQESNKERDRKQATDMMGRKWLTCLDTKYLGA